MRFFLAAGMDVKRGCISKFNNSKHKERQGIILEFNHKKPTPAANKRFSHLASLCVPLKILL